jgi:hypothetical protein
MRPVPLASLAAFVALVVFPACAGVDARSSAAALSPPMVRLRIGDGPVSAPVVHPAAGKARLVVQFPAGFAGRTVEVAIDRADSLDADAPRAAWQRFEPAVRADDTLVLTGLDVGRYWLEVACDGVAVGTGAVAIDGARSFYVGIAPAAGASPGR